MNVCEIAKNKDIPNMAKKYANPVPVVLSPSAM